MAGYFALRELKSPDQVGVAQRLGEKEAQDLEAPAAVRLGRQFGKLHGRAGIAGWGS